MNPAITPLKATSFGVLLIALWLIVLGIWHTFGLFYTFPSLPQYDMTVTYVTGFLIVLWQTLPLVIGIVLFRQHRTVIRLISGLAVAKNGEQDSWYNTPLLATLLVGLFGLFIAGCGLERFCHDHLIMWLILEIDNPHAGQHIGAITLWERLPLFVPTFFLIVLGLIFVVCARRIGIFIGYKIEQSLEETTEEEGKAS